ncbi:MAG: KUP/HAK/KT family potassium transporter [Deltaproteobacteria bacterium]|nr:KUP/HAK/KT family potassium transporter [Deltaproteobacteria bacterium]
MSSKPTDKTRILVIGALGIVFGDIGTSPLYTLKVCFSGQYAIQPAPANVLGLVSLIFWSLILVVSIKYSLFILRADDEGQGGIFAMLAGLHKKMGPKLGRKLVLAALFGSALLYGDGLITPVISVLSALEGLEMATTQAKPVVLPLACGILFALFWAQSHGTGRIGRFFGPVMVLWFSVIGFIGLLAIVHRPEILAAVDPRQAVHFFLNNGSRGFFLLGAVVLCITGCEALFADLGHFGLKPIRISWYFIALPALLCNYFGQGALLLANPQAAADPFYSLVPRTFLYPMVALATAATIIASQAIISGVFSLTRQAIQLGFFPRMRIVHTSEMAEGQVYTPDVNTMMMLAAILLALYFRQSENLADAYGIAVTGDMFITSMVFYFVTRRIWGWSRWRAAPLCLLFACLDLTYFSSCLGKIASGGWFPVAIALAIMVIMVTWWDGWKMLALKVMGLTLPLDKFMARISAAEPIRLPGTGVFLSTFHKEIPPMLLQYLIHTSALHEKLVLLSVVTADVPVVAESDRLEIHNMGREVYRVMARTGFMETPDAPRFLAQARAQGLNIDPENTKYYVGRISLVPAARRGMARWRRFLFTFMLRNAVSGSTYLNIPPAQVMEIGVQMEF